MKSEQGDAGAGMDKVYYSLYDRMLSEKGLLKAFRKVKSANGAAGSDRQSVADFAVDLGENLSTLAKELREKRYRPLPVLRVEIPKKTGGTRKLGIPAVRDRVVQQALLDILQPIFEPDFHPSSYGYRPGKSCHHAISKASLFMRKYELRWVVNLDLSKCFDTLKHEIIIQAFRRRIADGSILNLLKIFLKSGVMEDGVFLESVEGSPQGGVISPLIANVYLDAFDKFMMSKGHRIVRYADDILILSRSKSSAMNCLKVAKAFLEKKLLLKVNDEKTEITSTKEGVKYLGVVIYWNYTAIMKDPVKRFKEKVKLITIRNSPVNLSKVIHDLNPLLRGFANYFRIANCSSVFQKLAKWIRRRLRAKQLALWKKPGRLYRHLRQQGYLKVKLKYIKMSSWSSSNGKIAKLAMPEIWFAELGLYDIAAVKTGISVAV